MKNINLWKFTTFGLLGVVGLLLANVAFADGHKKAKIALKNLMTAEMNIEKLPEDQAGERKKALAHVKGAVSAMRSYVKSGGKP